MTTEADSNRETFISRHIIMRGIIATAIWVAVIIIYVAYTVQVARIPFEILQPAAFGGLLAGIVSPLAFLWFALLYYEQTRALRGQVAEQRRALLVQVASGLRKEFAENTYRHYGTVVNEFITSCRDEPYWVVFQRRVHSPNREERQLVDAVDEARRAVSDYCDNVLVLDDDDMIKKVIKKSLVVFLRDKIWNLEIARDTSFDRTRFDRLWKLYDMERPPAPRFPEVDNRPNV